MRMIDADALKMRLDDLEASGGHTYYRKGMDDTLHYFMPKIIKEAPTIDPEELRPKGRWIVEREKDTFGFILHFKCSRCEKCGANKTSYCPNCGAKMEDDNG